MSLPGLFSFALVYLVFVLSPGPGVAATVARGLGAGTRNAAGYVAGFVLGDLIWFTIAATGLATLAHQFETAFAALKYFGCAYLLRMSWRIWHAPVSVADVDADAAVPGPWSGFISTFTLTLSNPKVIVFFLSLMPLVVDVTAIRVPAYLAMAGVMALVCASSITAVLVLATQARRVFRSPLALRRINRGSAGLMTGAAVAIGLKD